MDKSVSLVTGGGSGIGLATARFLSEKGTVVVTDIDRENLAAVSREGFDVIQADVSREGDWNRVREHLAASFGRLDVLVHNAGIATIKPLPELTEAELLADLRVNLLSVLLGTKACWALLTESQGCIVNVASVAAFVGQEASCGYVASKGGVVSVTRALAVELAPRGVRVNCVCPGSTDTPLLHRHFQKIPKGDEARQRLIQRHPIGRLLTAEDVAPVIAFLASEHAAGITGSVWVVDGGLTATFDYGTTFAGGDQS